MGQTSSSDYGLQEWQETRSTIARFDNSLHDVRKYGFSFVTALLTANAILTYSISTTPGYIRLGILLVTFGLFVTLRQLDQHYRLFQGAAVRRSLILERRLNIELTSEITEYYNLSDPKVHWWKNVDRFYNSFLGLTVALGIAILYGGSNPKETVVESAILGAGALFSWYLMRRIRHQELPITEDWTIDKKVAFKDETIRIGWTRFGRGGHGRRKTIDSMGSLSPKQLTWDIISLATGNVVKATNANLNVSDVGDSEFEWLWQVDVPEGLYGFRVNQLPYFTIQVVRS